MKRPIPIGIDDFRALREQGMEHVDKSHFIRAAGVSPIHAFAAVFDGETVRVSGVPVP